MQIGSHKAVSFEYSFPMKATSFQGSLFWSTLPDKQHPNNHKVDIRSNLNWPRQYITGI